MPCKPDGLNSLLVRCKSTIINHRVQGNRNHFILIYHHNTFHTNILTRVGNLGVFSVSLCSKHLFEAPFVLDVKNISE